MFKLQIQTLLLAISFAFGLGAAQAQPRLSEPAHKLSPQQQEAIKKHRNQRPGLGGRRLEIPRHILNPCPDGWKLVAGSRRPNGAFRCEPKPPRDSDLQCPEGTVPHIDGCTVACVEELI